MLFSHLLKRMRKEDALLFAYKCCLLITFANSLDQNQAWQNIGPDLDPNCFSLMVFLKEKVDFDKIQQTKKYKK